MKKQQKTAVENRWSKPLKQKDFTFLSSQKQM